MKIATIIPAAGVGKRFAASPQQPDAVSPSKSKIELDLAGRPVFLRSVELFLNRPHVQQIILAVHPDTIDQFRLRWGDKLAFHSVQIVPGGRAERWETVMLALQAVDRACTHVAIHDAARPLASANLIDRVFAAAQQHPAVVPGIPVGSTLKQVEPPCEPPADHAHSDPLAAILGPDPATRAQVQRVVRTIDRSNLVEAQTPQVFEVGLLRQAYEQLAAASTAAAAKRDLSEPSPQDLRSVTDDASLVEALGEPVYVVEGETTNLKITRPQDLPLATAILEMRKAQSAAATARKHLFADEDDD